MLYCGASEKGTDGGIVMIYRDLYREGCSILTAAGVPEADLDARILLEYACHTNRNDLLVHGDLEVSREQEELYLESIAKRRERIPLQHITGEQCFCGLDFKVNEHVLIPRQDTEVLVERVLKDLKPGMRILDMCTGSGCILISLLSLSGSGPSGENVKDCGGPEGFKERNGAGVCRACSGVGVDISKDALEVAKENARRLLGEEALIVQNGQVVGDDAKGVQFVESDLFASVSGTYDVIVSNPPYIPSDVICTLMPEVKNHEPLLALDGTKNGLYFYKRIAEESPAYLKKGGRLYFEIGHNQAYAVSTLMAAAGFEKIEVIKDYAGLDRVACGRYPG